MNVTRRAFVQGAVDVAVIAALPSVAAEEGPLTAVVTGSVSGDHVVCQAAGGSANSDVNPIRVAPRHLLGDIDVCVGCGKTRECIEDDGEYYHYNPLCHEAIKGTANNDWNPLKHHHLVHGNECTGCGKTLQRIVDDLDWFVYEEYGNYELRPESWDRYMRALR